MSQELTSQKLKVILSLFELDINVSQACRLRRSSDGVPGLDRLISLNDRC